MAAPKQPSIDQMMDELRNRAVGPKQPVDPIGTAKSNLKGMYESAKRMPGNVKRMVQDPVAYAKSIPAPTGDQIMNALGPGNVGMAGIMIGPKAKTWNPTKAQMAEAMEAAGRTPEDIWYATGTYRGPEGKWRQEIDDSKAVHRTPDEIKGKARQLQDQQAMLKAAARESLVRGKEVVSDLFPKEAVAARQALKKQVGNIDDELSGYFGLKADPRRGNLMKYGYEHPELYAAYPELADYVMAQGKKGDPGVLGSMTGKDLELYQAGLNQKQPSSTVAHELQHAIQGIEGTPRGGNPYEFMRRRQYANEAIKGHNDALSYIAKRMDEASDLAVKRDLQATYDKMLERRAKASHFANIDPYQEYRLLGGEAEARMIQARLNMTPEQRAQTYPMQLSKDVAYDVDPKNLRLLDQGEVIDIYKAKGGEVESGLEKFLAPSKVKERLYHATPEDFSAFKAGGKDPSISGHAIWLSKDPERQPAAHNTQTRSGFREGVRVMPVHVQTKNPMVLDNKDMLAWAQAAFADGSREFPELMPKEWADAVTSEGYDSIIHADPHGRGDPHEIIMFHPSKIKSAIGNRGTYDSTNPDITMAEGGQVNRPSIAQMKVELNQQGMYSPLEKAAMAVPRPKGTPAEFMAEIGKQPGFRKEEVADRKISLPQQKMTKDEFLAHLKGHAAPKLQEKIIGGDEPDEDNGNTQYEGYKLPGGTNYREVLLKTPAFPEAKERQIMELEANIRRMDPADYPPGYVQNMVDGVAKLKAEKAAMGDKYQSSHWSDDPNVLAHIRLSDRFTPGKYGNFIVETTRAGGRMTALSTGDKGTRQQAEDFAQKLRDQGKKATVIQVGPGLDGKKLLHVEEIQSDWHQQGRKDGYGDTLKDGYKLSEQEPGFFHLKKDGMSMPLAFGSKEEVMNKARQQGAVNRGVPNAPFKKSWHELATKHILNHAANNGYDGIVITPGQEQADRYDLSKHVQNIYHSANADGTYHASVIGPRGQVLWEDFRSSPERIEQHLGKDIAQKITSGHGVEENGMRRLDAPDMKMGGEGMKGFYDKIVPDYLNKLGKPHGAQVQMNTHPVKGSPEDYGNAAERLGIAGVPMDQLTPEQNQKIADAADKKLHYFPITNSLRQQIKTEGLPQYQRGGIIHRAEGGSTDEDYRAEHTAPGPDFGAPMHDVTSNGMYPKDFYSPNGLRYYADDSDPTDRDAYNKIARVKGKPNEMVFIHRAIPSSVYNEALKKDAPLKHMIRKGDWVAINKEYAKNHGESVLNGNYKIASMRVPARHVWTNADSIHEFGYHPDTASSKIIHKAEGGNVATLEQMKAQLMSKSPLGLSQLQSVGAKEAPNLAIKAYLPPGGREEGSMMPVGGVDMNMQPGHQLMPQSAMPPQPPQGMPGAPGQPPMAGGMSGGLPMPGGAPAPQQPGGSNILQMTPQGQAMAAMGGGRPPMPPQMPPQMPPRPMADGGSMSDKSPKQMKAEMAGKDASQEKRVTVNATGAGGVKGIVVPKHLIEGNPKAGAEGLKNMMNARAQVYGEEHREPLNLGQVGKIHKQTLEEHFAKPLDEQKKAEQEALNKIRAAKFIKHNKDTLDESEKLDTVEHEHDEQGRSHVGYASKGIAGHALFPQGHGDDMDYKVINTCPGQTEGCGGGKSAEGIVDTKQGTCFAPNAESQYGAAVSRRAGHAIAKHDPAMTRDWIIAHTGSMRNAANRADKQNKRMLYRPNVVDETDVSSRHVIRHLNEQRKTDDKPPIIANSYGKTNELHDPENGYYVTHSNVGPKVKKGQSISENISRDKARVRNTVMAADNQGDFKNAQGNKTPPKGSYMVTDVKRGSPMAASMEGAITHAKYWSTGRAEHELSDEEKKEGPEGHFSGSGRKTSEENAHYGHTTQNGLRYDYQRQHILHPRLVQVGKNDDGTPHIIPTDSRFKDEEFLPKNRYKTKNGKDAGHILMTTPTESTSNIGHQTSFTHHVGPEHVEHAKKNNGEYVIDKPEDQAKAAGKEYAAPQAIKFQPKPKKYAMGGSVGGRHVGFSDDDFHAFPEQNVVAQRHMAMRHGDDELEEKQQSSRLKRKINVHKDLDTMAYELSRKTKAK